MSSRQPPRRKAPEVVPGDVVVGLYEGEEVVGLVVLDADELEEGHPILRVRLFLGGRPNLLALERIELMEPFERLKGERGLLVASAAHGIDVHPRSFPTDEATLWRMFDRAIEIDVALAAKITAHGEHVGRLRRAAALTFSREDSYVLGSPEPVRQAARARLAELNFPVTV